MRLAAEDQKVQISKSKIQIKLLNFKEIASILDIVFVKLI